MVKRQTDYTGHTYGKLTAIKEVDSPANNKRRYYLFKCECGVEKSLALSLVKNGKIKSCGCAKRKNDIQKKYNKLTIIRELDISERSGEKREFLCRCDCGSNRIATLNALTQGTVKSCGCLRSERYDRIDLTNQIFGRLTVIEKAGTKNKQRMWRCKCLCGKEKIATTSSLNNGSTKSCGCLKEETVREKLNLDKQRIDGIVPQTLRRKTTNKTGVKGVYERINGDHIYYQARIGINKKTIVLGSFKTIEEAKKARQNAELIYHQPILDKAKQKGV